MRKISLILLFSTLTISVSAQTNTFPASGSVGIGTLTPAAPLQVEGNLIIGSSAANTYHKLIINGPNTPNNIGSKRDISFEFAAAGSSLVRSYRGSSYDTYLQFLTTPNATNTPVERMHIHHDGNVGIGTTAPSEKVDVSGNIRSTRIISTQSTGTAPFTVASQTVNTNLNADLLDGFHATSFQQQTNINTTFTTADAGWHRVAESNASNGRGNFNVWIYTEGGTVSPEFINIKGLKTWDNYAWITQIENSRTTHWTEARVTTDGTKAYLEVNFNKAMTGRLYSRYEGLATFVSLSGALSAGGGTILKTLSSAKGINVESLYASDNLSIGNTTVPTGYKLAVKGNVIAEKLVVKTSTAWPDFVFKKDYKLPSLNEVEQFISKNSHLPEIPSAKEVETNGQDVGEMNRLLLKKVEEVTLYLIELKKENQEMKKENDSLKRRIEKLEK